MNGFNKKFRWIAELPAEIGSQSSFEDRARPDRPCVIALVVQV
jgi:hypothetical protein